MNGLLKINDSPTAPTAFLNIFRNMITFRKRYFILALFLLLIEVLIALFLHDGIIRPYIGDFLVVILIYCFIRSFISARVLPTAIGVLIFAYAIESLQYLDLIGRLGLRES